MNRQTIAAANERESGEAVAWQGDVCVCVLSQGRLAARAWRLLTATSALQEVSPSAEGRGIEKGVRGVLGLESGTVSAFLQ